jgi:chorismate synthase
VLSSEQSFNTTTPTREEKKMKVKSRIETAMKISQHLGASLERSIGGLSLQVGELAAALKPDREQAEWLMKVEGKLSIVEGALVKSTERLGGRVRLPPVAPSLSS